MYFKMPPSSSSSSPSPSASSFYYALIYFLLFAALGLLGPFIPLFFFNEKGYSKVQIGFLISLQSLILTICSPLIGIVADRFLPLHHILVCCLGVSQFLTLGLYFSPSFFVTVSLVIISSILKAPTTSLLDTFVLAQLTDKSTYGSLRLWGAISFGLLSLAGGVIITPSRSTVIAAQIDTPSNTGNGTSTTTISQQPSPPSRYLYLFVCALGFALLACVAIMAVVYQQQKPHSSTVTDGDGYTGVEASPPAAASSGAEHAELEMTETGTTCDTGRLEVEAVAVADTAPAGDEATVLSVLLSGRVVIFIIIVFLSGFGGGVIDAFLFLRLTALGASGPLLGLARFIMCAFEVPCFHVAGTLHKRLGTFLLLALCQLAFVVRFVWYAFLVDPLLVLPAEVLHGVTFAVTWSTALVFADRVAPPKGKAFLIAVVEGAHWGLGSGCGALVGGHIYEKNGAVVLFQICAGLAAFSMLLALVAAVVFREGKTGGATDRTVTIIPRFTLQRIDVQDYKHVFVDDDNNIEDEAVDGSSSSSVK